MEDLPDYTVARDEDGYTAVKKYGKWYPAGVDAVAGLSDTDFWDHFPDALVVALPTYGPITREWAALCAHDVVTFKEAMARASSDERR